MIATTTTTTKTLSQVFLLLLAIAAAAAAETLSESSESSPGDSGPSLGSKPVGPKPPPAHPTPSSDNDNDEFENRLQAFYDFFDNQATGVFIVADGKEEWMGTSIPALSEYMGCEEKNDDDDLIADAEAYTAIPTSGDYQLLVEAYSWAMDRNQDQTRWEPTVTDYRPSVFEVPVEVRSIPHVGRGVFALEDIPKGTLVTKPTNEIEFYTKEIYRDFVAYSHARHSKIICDTILWMYSAMKTPEGEYVICLAADDSSLLNDGMWDEEEAEEDPYEDYEDEDDDDYDDDWYDNDDWYGDDVEEDSADENQVEEKPEVAEEESADAPVEEKQQEEEDHEDEDDDDYDDDWYDNDDWYDDDEEEEHEDENQEEEKAEVVEDDEKAENQKEEKPEAGEEDTTGGTNDTSEATAVERELGEYYYGKVNLGNLDEAYQEGKRTIYGCQDPPTYAIRDIKAGEELFIAYADFSEADGFGELGYLHG